MKLEGRSFHENAIEYFREIIEWLDHFLTSDFKTFTFDCAMDYFNSSTVKLLFNMIMKMDRYASSDNIIVINWMTVKNNEIMIECGEDFKEEISNVTFNMIIN
jgi:hypothetical protein